MPHRPRPSSVGVRLAERAAAPEVLAFLVGASTPLLVLGFLERSYSLLDCSPLTFQLAGGAACASLALGQRLPRGLLRRLLSRVEARWMGSPADDDPSWVPRPGPVGAARQLASAATALVALVAGLLAAVLPLLLDGADAVLGFARAAFLWHPALLVGCEAVVLFAAGALPFAAVGLLIRSVHHLGGPYRPWDAAPSGTILLGAAGSCLVLFAVAPFPLPASPIIQAGAALLLGTAMLAVTGHVPAAKRAAPTPRRGVQEPETGDSGAALLALALMAVAGGGASALLAWVHIVGLLAGAPPQRRYAAAAAMLAAAAVGLRSAARRGGPSLKLRDLGRHVSLAGLALACGAAFFNLVVRSSDALFARTPGHALLWVVTAALPFVAVGRAWGFVVQAWVRRSDAPERAGARALRMTGIATCAAVLLAVVPLVNRLGTYATLVAAALGLVAMGGTLLIHAPQGPRERSWVDVTGVFAAVAVLALLLPRAGECWLRDRQHRQAQVVESWWGSFTVDGQGRVWAFGGDAPPAGSRGAPLVPIAGAGPRGVVALTDSGHESPPVNAGMYRLSYAPEVAARCVELRADGAGAAAPHEDIPALRFLRTTRQRYGLLLVDLGALPRTPRERLATPAFLHRAMGCLAPGGLLAVAGPEGEDPEALLERVVDAATRTPAARWAALLESADGRPAGVLLAAEAPRDLALRGGFRVRVLPLVPESAESADLLAHSGVVRK